MDAVFSTGCSWHAPTLELRHLLHNGPACPTAIHGTIPSMICRFIVFALAHPLFHSYMRHRCSAMRFSHPYGSKPQRAANPSSSSLNISSRKSSVPCHVQVICTKYMDAHHRKAGPACRWLMTWAPRRIQQSFRYLSWLGRLPINVMVVSQRAPKAHRPTHTLSNQNTSQRQRAFGRATHNRWRALICERLPCAPPPIPF